MLLSGVPGGETNSTTLSAAAAAADVLALLAISSLSMVEY